MDWISTCLTVLIINKMEGGIFNSLKYIWIILMKTTESGLFPVTSRYIFTVGSACFCLIGNKTVICHPTVLPTPFKYTYLCNSWLTQFGSVLFFIHTAWLVGFYGFPSQGSNLCRTAVEVLCLTTEPPENSDPHNVSKVDSLHKNLLTRLRME